MDNAQKLIDLARKKFRDLTVAEAKMFEAAAKGELAECSADDEGQNDPAKAAEWGDERVLKADRIAWLCADPQASALVTHRGISLKGARIDGDLDLRFMTICFPLVFERSAFPGKLHLREAEIRALSLSGCRTGPIDGNGLTIGGDLSLDQGFEAQGNVDLCGATIREDLICSNGRFINPGGHALSGHRLKAKGTVHLGDGFKAKGEVALAGATIGGGVHCSGANFRTDTKEGTALNLMGATIGGDLSCVQSTFKNKKGKALRGDRINVKGSVFLAAGFEAEGEVRLLGAHIGGDLLCRRAHLSDPKGRALDAGALEVGGDVLLGPHLKARGTVVLAGARVGGRLRCARSHLWRPRGVALAANGLRVDGDLCLHGQFRATGEVRLLGAKIGSDLDCADGHFKNKKGVALGADGIDVKGSVFLRHGFEAQGEVRLLGGTVGGVLDCADGHFKNKKGVALGADRIEVKGSVFLDKKFEAVGEVRLPGARIAGSLSCGNGRFSHDSQGDAALQLQGATIGGDLSCRGAHVSNEEGKALSAESIEVKGNAFLDEKFEATGTVVLSRASVAGILGCAGGRFNGTQGMALTADGIDVKGGVFLNAKFGATGEVRLLRAKIGGDLDCTGGRFTNEDGRALNADGMDVKGGVFLCLGFEAVGQVSLVNFSVAMFFQWWGVELRERVTLDLRNAAVGTLRDDADSWPAKGCLRLDGLKYNNLADDAPKDPSSRIDWLGRQPADQFRPQPYEHLATVLRATGHEEAPGESTSRRPSSGCDGDPTTSPLGYFAHAGTRKKPIVSKRQESAGALAEGPTHISAVFSDRDGFSLTTSRRSSKELGRKRGERGIRFFAAAGTGFSTGPSATDTGPPEPRGGSPRSSFSALSCSGSGSGAVRWPRPRRWSNSRVPGKRDSAVRSTPPGACPSTRLTCSSRS